MKGSPVLDKQTRLGELETVIERGLTTFVEVGNAIREIQESKLYKESHDTFEAYCRDRWGWSRGRAYQMIEAANTVEVLSTNVDIPNEAVAREIAPLAKEDPDAAREVYKQVKAERGEKLTATDLRQAVRERVEFQDWLISLPPGTRAVVEHADENDDKQRNLLRNSNQREHISNIANKHGDQASAEVALAALTEEGGNVFKAYEQRKEISNPTEAAAKKWGSLINRANELAGGIRNAGGASAIGKHWPEQNRRIVAKSSRDLGEQFIQFANDLERG